MQLAKQGKLLGAVIFVFTDNSTAKAAFSQESSINQKLFNMVKQVELVEMLFETRVHISHIAGKRMIAQCADGLSRGCLTDGVMVGKEMTSFLPLHLSALFIKQPNFMWSPPPCVAENCMEELRKAQQKHQWSTHVFVSPKTMSCTWHVNCFALQM